MQAPSFIRRHGINYMFSTLIYVKSLFTYWICLGAVRKGLLVQEINPIGFVGKTSPKLMPTGGAIKGMLHVIFK